MCRRVTCKTCGKPSWAGCGAHVEQVLGDVPKRDRCQGHTKAEVSAAAAAAPKKRWFSRG
ncbi:MAG: hypothetical protein NTZ21_12730 [Actinobacteria bacterium]|jgi:hypothetical protein|nr:hypothetical protein [Actinomycetota bacterium]